MVFTQASYQSELCTNTVAITTKTSPVDMLSPDLPRKERLNIPSSRSFWWNDWPKVGKFVLGIVFLLQIPQLLQPPRLVPVRCLYRFPSRSIVHIRYWSATRLTFVKEALIFLDPFNGKVGISIFFALGVGDGCLPVQTVSFELCRV